MFFPTVSVLLWPLTPEILLARWWWTILLSRQTATRSTAAASATPAAKAAADVSPAVADNIAPVSRKSKA